MAGVRVASAAGPGSDTLASALEAQRERLLPCVHCGFCLPACPTYERLGDENDSPRGRLHLMQAVVDGRLDAASDAFHTHIDRCLGCRACEPVCPSGVEYGTLLELAREAAARARPPALPTRLLLSVMGSRTARSPFFVGGRMLRATGLASLGARILPSEGVLGTGRLGLAMLAASADGTDRIRRARPAGGAHASPLAEGTSPDTTPADPESPNVPSSPSDPPSSAFSAGRRARVGLLEGCVQKGLFERINAATARTLRFNGYDVVPVPMGDCCGALHAHGGDLDGARRLAQRNMDAFERADVDLVVTNAAGCGAAMKEYGTLFDSDADLADRAGAFARRVRDVSELLEEAGPRPGAEVPCTLAYDHPCHLQHAQGLAHAPLAVLGAVPGTEVRVIEGADECCGGAGIYGITHPDLGGRIGRDKVAAVRAAAGDAACTPNPGCMMQIGAGLRLEGARADVVHPVEILDESYRKAGYYE